MNLIVISDIFGRTPALENICKDLSDTVARVQLIDPYMGVDHEFKTETLAYDFFMSRVGLNRYASIIMNCLSPSGPDKFLIGFSVGASAIWSISGHLPDRGIKKAFCFYGSQIRQYPEIDPCFDMELIFPAQEIHFDVDELIQTLQAKDRVCCSKANGLHGFMNQLSPNFDPACYALCMTYLKSSLRH